MRALLCIVAGCLAGCCGPDSAYLRADQLTYEAVAPEFTRYVVGDPELTQAQKDRRILLLATWRKRITSALDSTPGGR